MKLQKIRHSLKSMKIEKNVWDETCIAMNTLMVVNGTYDNWPANRK